MRVATIGIGSNSVRMLTADIQMGQCRTILRDRAGTRLFAALDEKGNLDPRAMEATLQAVREQHDKAKALGAEEVTVFATSAVRDARNKRLFCDAVLERTGAMVDVLSGEMEAALSFLGASDGQGYTGVIDIGGGSTEIVTGAGSGIGYSGSLQMGAVRLSNLADITCAQDMDAVLHIADSILDASPLPPLPLPEKWVGVGGTFTTLAAIVHRMAWTEKTCVQGLAITRGEALDAARMLAPLTLKERAAVPGMRPQRADIVVHGICALLACMRRMHLERIVVSENGNLHGYLYRRYAPLFTESLHK